ncbi:MAG: hypothetical protein HQL97_15970, partial [Magnetococcales bacterium]|nr:hypothetical protein [Magnetococcales bacterium]
QANEEEAEASKKAAASIRKQYESLGQDLEGVIERIDKVDAALSRDHKLILTADTEKVKQAAAEVDELLEKRERVIKVKAELMDVSKDLQNVRENIANGLVEPVQQGFDKMKKAFENFASLFKTFDPTITFDVRSAQSSIESLRDKFTGLQEQFKQKSTLQIDGNSADPVLVKLQEILKRMETIDGKRIEYTIVQHTVETHAAGGPVGGWPARKLAGGGHLPGFGGGDRIHALLEAGEFVIPKEAVRHYGLGLMVAIQRMRLAWPELPQFKAGGLIQRLTIPEIPAYASGGSIVAPPRGRNPLPFIDPRLYEGRERESFAPVKRFDIRINDQPVSDSWDAEEQLQGLVRTLQDKLRARTVLRRAP